MNLFITDNDKCNTFSNYINFVLRMPNETKPNQTILSNEMHESQTKTKKKRRKSKFFQTVAYTNCTNVHKFFDYEINQKG